MLSLAMALLVPSTAMAASTAVPGHQGKGDADNNGYPDQGVVVTGKYVSVYSYDANGDWYWDLGDGRTQGTVASADELDQDTLTTCTYQNVYRGTYNNDPYMDSGWISNQINCTGYEKGTYNATYVSQDDPRYTGTGTRIWVTWEVHRDTWSQYGNVEQTQP